MKNALLMIAIAAILGGCASAGNQKLAEENGKTVAQKIQENVTTKSEVQRHFGDPSETSFTDGGLEIWKYHLTDLSADAVNYIPVVNLFGSSASGTKKELVVLYDDKGIVKKYSMSESEVSQKTGLFNN
ncbi:hypothetical protein [Thiomicrorhabdus indica]|uniref:hypothetical protein n=1 Tax=Thiomicrorhabdus indica TaxID=2267253 RepID=UPI002AA70EB1|nr:hypothetical protein [Thiomicrorhabdus indica]